MTGSDDEEAPDPNGATDRSESLDAADAFSLLGDATRLEIVAALHDDALDPPVPFSELHDRVGLDDSGQFGYHLKQLVPHFVEKSADGYALTAAGQRIARAVAAGLYTDSPRLEPFPVPGECLDCGESDLRASYADEHFRIVCRACNEVRLAVHTPPSLVRGRSPAAFVEAFQEWSWTQVDQAVRGVCPDCGGAVEPSVDDDPADPVAVPATARFGCTVCGRVVETSFGGVAARDPIVQAFLERRGDPLRDRPYWSVPQFVSGEHVEVLDREPWRVRVSFYADGDACRVEMDGDLAVVEATVVPGGAPA